MRPGLRILLSILMVGAASRSIAAPAPAPDLSRAVAPLDDRVALKLDPRLAAALATPEEPVSVWVSFADKGERSPGDLAMMLARAEAELSPRSRARRERARVSPLVDYLDVPLHAPYVEALRARGLAPYGQSRWFNRVALRVPAGRLVELAALAFVERLRPVELATRMRPVPEEVAPTLIEDMRPVLEVAGRLLDPDDVVVRAA